MSDAQTTIRIAGYQPETTVNSRAMREFARLIAGDGPGGPIVADVTGSILDLGLPTAVLASSLADGTFDIAYTTSLHFHRFVPELAAFDIPFLVASRERALAVLDRGVRPKLHQAADAGMPVRVLAIWDNGVRQVSNNVRPIHQLEDCQGLRLRTQKSALIARGLGLVGFETIEMDIGLLTDAIRRGEVDAQENPLINTHGFGLDRLHPYIALTSHLVGVSLLACSAITWNRWTADVRDRVMAAAAAATRLQRALAVDEDVRLRASMTADGTRFTEIAPDARRQFVAAIAPMLAEHREVLLSPALDGLADPGA